MQPNNQAGVPPQAPQPRPVPSAPVSQQQATYVTNERGERVIQPLAQPVAPQPMPQAQPVAASAPQPVTQTPQPAPVAVPQQPGPQPAPVVPVALGATAVETQVNNSDEFVGAADEDYAEGDIDLSQPVSWQAKEFIHREKTAVWYVAFVVVLLVLLGLSIFMRAWSFTALLVVIAVVIVGYTNRPPRSIGYTLSDEGLDIDGMMHAYDDFKSFGIIRDGEEFSVMLIPRKRFQPGITVYFPEEAGEDIVDALGSRLPMRDLKLDIVDRIVRKLRL